MNNVWKNAVNNVGKINIYQLYWANKIENLNSRKLSPQIITLNPEPPPPPPPRLHLFLNEHQFKKKKYTK